MDIGKKIKTAREMRGLGVNQLAKLAGISGATITRWEKGQRQPRLNELSRVLDVLKISFDELSQDPGFSFSPDAALKYETDENDIRSVLNNCPTLSQAEIEFIMNIVESKGEGDFLRE
jgi:transcriptional regulator with XRE-family HTH domain